MSETMNLKICGFYAKYENLGIELKLSNTFDRYRSSIGNMEGELFLKKGVKQAYIKQGDMSPFDIEIEYISSIAMHGLPDYVEIQFGTSCAFRLIIHPDSNVSRSEVEKFLGFLH